MACCGEGQWRATDEHRTPAYTSRRDVCGMSSHADAASGRAGVSSDTVLVDAAEAINGEGPQWDERRRRLWWVDMREPALRFFEPAGGRTQSWQMPSWIGCFGL